MHEQSGGGRSQAASSLQPDYDMSKIDQIGNVTAPRPPGELPLRNPDPQTEGDAPNPAKSGWIWVVVLLVVLGAAGFWAMRKHASIRNAVSAGKGKGQGAACTSTSR